MGAPTTDRFAGLTPGQAMDAREREEAVERAIGAVSPEDRVRARLSLARAAASFHVLKQAGAGKPWRVLWSTGDEDEAMDRYGRAKPTFKVNRMIYCSVLVVRGNPASMVGREVLVRSRSQAMPPQLGDLDWKSLLDAGAARDAREARAAAKRARKGGVRVAENLRIAEPVERLRIAEVVEVDEGVEHAEEQVVRGGQRVRRVG